MDPIDRQALIDVLLRTTTFGNVHELNKFVHKCHLDGAHMGGLRDAVFAIVNAPAVQPEVLACGSGELNAQSEQRWIPCSERLPEEDDYKSCIECLDGAVWYFTENGTMGLGYYYMSTKEWSTTDDLKTSGKVIAWQPLPEPYRKEGAAEYDKCKR